MEVEEKQEGEARGKIGGDGSGSSLSGCSPSGSPRSRSGSRELQPPRVQEDVTARSDAATQDVGAGGGETVFLVVGSSWEERRRLEDSDVTAAAAANGNRQYSL